MEIKELVEGYKDEMVKSVQEIVKIKSVEEEKKEGMPFGEGPYKALENILNLGESMGFKVKNLDGYAGYIEYGEGEESVGILGHVDVVPEGSDWDFPPYGAEIHDGKIIGRGTIDDKGPMIAALYGMKAIKEAGLKLNRRVRMIVGANEETNWECMDHYFKHEETPTMAFTPDADFPVIFAEKGIRPARINYSIKDGGYEGLILEDICGGTAKNMVAAKAEAVLSGNIDGAKEKIEAVKLPEGLSLIVEEMAGKLVIKTSGKSAHGSTPEKGISAIHGLMKALGQVFTGDDETSNFVKLYNERIGFYHHGEKIGAGYEDEVSGKLSFNPGVISMENGQINLVIDIRYPVTSKFEDIEVSVRKNLEGTGMDFKFTEGGNLPLHVDKENFLVQKLMEVYREETGDYDSEPIAIGGGTYARAMDNAVAFGALMPGMEELAHQKNEYIGVDHLVQLANIYGRAIYELAK